MFNYSTRQDFINFSTDKNFSRLRLKGLTLYFSYSTVIAFRSKQGLVISKNCWSKTTGKHLNDISRNKKIRLDYSEFEKKLKNILTKKGLI